MIHHIVYLSSINQFTANSNQPRRSQASTRTKTTKKQSKKNMIFLLLFWKTFRLYSTGENNVVIFEATSFVFVFSEAAAQQVKPTKAFVCLNLGKKAEKNRFFF